MNIRLSAALLAASLLLSLAACAPSKEADASTGWTPLQMVLAIRDSQQDPPGMAELLPGDEVYAAYLTESYGLTEEVADGAILAAGGASAQELAVLRLAEDADADGAADALCAYLETRTGAFTGYLPEETALLENSQVAVRGRYVALLACEDTVSALAAFETCFTEAPPAETGAAAPAPPAGSVEAAPSYIPPPSASRTSAPEPWSYDESRLLEAWAAGDWSGLSKEDRAILEVCAQVIANLAPDSLSDYEKELAIHDWMLTWGRYDSNTLSGLPYFQENSNNDNPYGFLVDGQGVCLGYASTFQLFMDLLGIECITVEGTAYSDTAAHAWNQVRLEGAWYCVDVTWDDSTTSGPLSERTAHRYFNVTSQHMRDTDHQWEELAVPEAAGTVYAWS